MRASLILSTVFLFCIGAAQSAHCPSASARWCETREVAEACGVIEQCTAHVWSVRDESDKVEFALYYESLCPSCRQFTTTQLWKAYQSVLDIVNITLVPYGNAQETYQPATQLYDFVCQHGADECLGNLIHTCVLYYYPTIQEYMPFINCTESTDGDVKTIATQCAAKCQIDFSKIDACTQSKLGNQLQHAYAVQTDNLQPPHKFVPWVTVNGRHTEIIQLEAQRDLVRLLCKTYKGASPPAACKRYLFTRR